MHRPAGSELAAGGLRERPAAAAVALAAASGAIQAVHVASPLVAAEVLLLLRWHANGTATKAAATAAQGMVITHIAHALRQAPIRCREPARIKATQTPTDAQLRGTGEHQHSQCSSDRIMHPVTSLKM